MYFMVNYSIIVLTKTRYYLIKESDEFETRQKKKMNIKFYNDFHSVSRL